MEHPVLYITRRAEFSASHRYYDPNLSPEENEERFGIGARPFGHGHNYAAELTIQGEVDRKTGIVRHTREIKEALEKALKDWDHRNLNELPEFRSQMPTLENIARVLWGKLQSDGGPELGMTRLRVYEEPELYVDYEGQ